MTFCGNSDYIFSTGFSKIAEREFGVWDIREMKEPVTLRRLDDYTGVAFPFFDESHNIIFISAKGEVAITYYQFSTSGNYLDKLSAFKSKDPQKGFSFLPRDTVNVLANETMRGVRMSQTCIEYVKFSVPKKAGTF
jgi:hypothetical protein